MIKKKVAIRQKETLFGPLGLWEGIKEAQGFFLFTFFLAEKSLLQGLARRWMAPALAEFSFSVSLGGP